MFNNASLSIVIGLVFIYLLYSLLATILQELWSTNTNMRGKVLRKAIKRMLNDREEKVSEDTLGDLFYEHPLIKYLSAGNMFCKYPAYINPETFAKVMVDLLRGHNLAVGDSSGKAIAQNLSDGNAVWVKKQAIDDDTLRYLKSLWFDSQGDVFKFSVLLENWFEEMMDRASGWYKKKIQWILFIIGFLIAILFNVDTVSIVQKLESSSVLRDQVLAQASAFTKAHPDLDKPGAKKEEIYASSPDLKKIHTNLYAQAAALTKEDVKTTNDLLALGWPDDFCAILQSVSLKGFFGWILTALAISLGAPFWFDLLNKVMKLRGSVPENEPKAKTTSAKVKGRVG